MRIKKHPVVRKIEGDVEKTLADFGYELVQMKFGGGAGGRTLSIFIDRVGRASGSTHPDGVTATDCQEMSRRLSLLLDMLDPIPGAYTLVVSSPGLDRPLTRDGDFERFKGEHVAVRHRPSGGARKTQQGLLRGVANEQVLLQIDDECHEIPLAEVEEAHLIYDWTSDT